ncbi:hypothetical protein [Coleofasciculus sp. FACHB-SPT36]|uniref:hypothetical protein n=1 Tax=Cyanophyceae TaxID=3028117 RepID=UPI00168B6910|nr:hypothetical protein [Coleofasciculus sp. FACHB-SPT36]MBD2541266.1 hypothetical protein [Coleofasciculus sp. FACHB-SPT36]
MGANASRRPVPLSGDGSFPRFSDTASSEDVDGSCLAEADSISKKLPEEIDSKLNNMIEV